MWLCLHLPQLALDIATRGTSNNQPLVIADGQGTRTYIHQCNPPALAHGVVPGMALNAAHALIPQLRVLPRNLVAELAALQQLASWANQFTSIVSRVPPHALVLEIGGSLALFGDMTSLQNAIAQGCAELGYQATFATAPTPLAATLFARQPDTTRTLANKDWKTRLAQTPIQLLDLDATVLTALHSVGVYTIADCEALPHAQLSARFGTQLTLTLDRAFGRQADPRRAESMPECFYGQVQFPANIHHSEALLFAARRLLHELAGYLRARQHGCSEFCFELAHDDIAPTVIPFQLLSNSRDSQNWLLVVKDRFERLQLNAPADAITLRANNTFPLASSHDDWLVEQGTNSPDTLLIERLQARLGTDAVHSLAIMAEHRPEQAWAYCAPTVTTQQLHTAHKKVSRKRAVTRQRKTSPTTHHQPTTAARPLWLLAEPLLLKMEHNRPYYDGSLTLQQGPERIESGWWDGADTCRDYFVACNPLGERLWIFRDHKNLARWFLHGLFG